ncbi:S8 family serine peptidase [Brumimicrobium aurantiacum]|uniref:T9SS C-terminal target domain-containing protein n=1 Tax=Brumimicrobium aurantiacum TaxID=1737063 RepID=A0A3E1EUP3_9FLAO|nr:S8 family serine peptidase [Brumimicrobium aurantiacum]RFC53284.1 T9SS C-terminal target domain-containing protein [Brumimicrobium aurantiacum]
MKKLLLISLVLPLVHANVIAQSPEDRARIIALTDTVSLNKKAKEWNARFENGLTISKKLDIPKQIISTNNQRAYLAGFDFEGRPVYDTDDNLDLAFSSRIDRIWSGGSSGLNLDGSGIEIGHWEAGGLALISHQEYNGRVTHAENETVTSHATHTAGTMIGTGIESDARGIASSATIISRRSNNDEAEMAAFGAAGGIVSNHSYSSGNPNGDLTKYGLYNYHSEDWDEIAYDAPYLTICKSAGNNRNDGVNSGDNGYDLMYTTAASKNVITIGAVNDVPNYINPQSVIQSSFTNWGPTDDWRIKPDITANGVSVYSADNANDTDYSTKSGTSMSAPAVTGAVTLLQEHYYNNQGFYMKSATVRALLQGTTDEAGANDGPDFQSGWGLMNAERAAEVITNMGISSELNELSLADNESYSTLIITEGGEPLTATIAWTDPAGTPVTSGGVDDQTLILVNDLDIRITNAAGTEIYEPWVLTPNSTSDNFTDAATKGDNYRDNFERIDVDFMPQGIYTVSVTHKNNLVNGFQDFSLMINGARISSLSTDDFPQKDLAFVVYPNPSSNGLFNVNIPNEVKGTEFKVEVIDLLGRTNKSEVFNENQFSLDLTNMNGGIFILKIQGNGKMHQELIRIKK